MKTSVQAIFFLKNIFLFSFLVLLSWQCGTPTEKEKNGSPTTFANFYVRYLQTEALLKGQVTFGKGDVVQETKPIEMKKVTFLNSGMEKKEVQGKFSRYIYQAPTPNILSKFTFDYTDEKGKEHQQVLEMNPIDSFSIQEGYSKSKGLVLQLEGRSVNLTAEEDLVLLFFNKENKVTTLEVGGPSTNPNISFTGEQLNGLSLGKNKLYIVKKQNRYIQKNNSEIASTIEFYSKTLELEMTE